MICYSVYQILAKSVKISLRYDKTFILTWRPSAIKLENLSYICYWLCFCDTVQNWSKSDKIVRIWTKTYFQDGGRPPFWICKYANFDFVKDFYFYCWVLICVKCTKHHRNLLSHHNVVLIVVQCESKKSPLRGHDIFHFFTNGSEFLIKFLHTYFTFLSTLDCQFLFNYPRFWRSYAILSATTQFT